MLSNTFSKSFDIASSPSIAFPRLITDDRMILVNLLNLISSYCKTVFIDSL